MQEVKKIVVIGPESTGKSSLCQLLSKHYDTIWCPEFAREYLLERGTNYTYNDLLAIAKGQIALEDEYIIKARKDWQIKNSKLKNPVLFVDTDMNVMKVWCEYVFGKCHTYILNKITERKSNLYLLCNIDLPWVKDELREYPDLQSRKELFYIYKDILINQNIPWTIISGHYEERLQIAIKSIDEILFN
ncbi:MAG TPA: ATP-binding protein [Segetibacter sp.]|nr:ATP-binding protein [Segetibacter sp.]